METLEAIRTRRSVRAFTDAPVDDADMEILLRAAMAAPSASNERPWRFIVVRDPHVLERLSKSTPFAGLVRGAPAAVVVAADRAAAKYPGFWVIDCAAAIQNLLLAAHARGLGGVWIGVHPMRPFSWNVRRVMGLPRHVAPHSIVAIGHPAAVPAPVDRFEPDWIRSESWRATR